MRNRLATAFVGIPLLVAVILAGGVVLRLVAVCAASAGAVEVCRMARFRAVAPPTLAAAALAAALVVLARYEPFYALAGGAVAAAASTVLLLSPVFRKVRWARVLGVTLGAAAYPGALLAYAPLIREGDQGLAWISFALIVTFSTDTAAFFVGKAIGKRPLAPAVSPNKTREGAIGGALAALVSALVSATALSIDASWTAVALLGILLGIVGQAGDLFESKLKRLSGVKESGRLLPGHGGILDRLDSIVFNLAVVYYFVLWGAQ